MSVLTSTLEECLGWTGFIAPTNERGWRRRISDSFMTELSLQDLHPGSEGSSYVCCPYQIPLEIGVNEYRQMSDGD